VKKRGKNKSSVPKGHIVARNLLYKGCLVEGMHCARVSWYKRGVDASYKGCIGQGTSRTRDLLCLFNVKGW
jgi:hypothetical protein